MRALEKIVFMTERNCMDMSISFFLGEGNMTLQSAYLFLAVSHFNLRCGFLGSDLEDFAYSLLCVYAVHIEAP